MRSAISTTQRVPRFIWRASALGAIALLSALALVSCSDAEPGPPTMVIIASERPYLERSLEIAAELLERHGIVVVAAAPGDEPHITVGQLVEAGSQPFVTGYWVLVTGLSNQWRNPLGQQSVAFNRLSDLHLIVPDSPTPPLEEWNATPSLEVVPLSEIPDALQENPEAFALLPLDAVDARVQSILVGSASVVFDDPGAQYPLVERAWVSAAAHEDPDFALLLQQTKQAIADQLALEYARPDPIILHATGDIIPARCVYAKQRDSGDFAHAFRVLGSWISQADITIGSLDASISDAGRPFGCTQTFSLLAPAQSVEGLVYAGFDVITVATNHVKDCGQDSCGNQAFFDTLDILRSNDIQPVGGGADLAEARQPAFLDVRGTTFAFLGADQIASYNHAAEGVAGVAPLTEAFLREDVAAAVAQADVVVVLPQWGVEYTNHPTASQQALAAAAADAGADLVIGNHPHWVQAVDVLGETYVAYALGNFVFDQDWSIPTQQGVVLEAAFHGAELKGVRLHPIRINNQYQPVSADPAEANEILGRIWAASAVLP